MLRVRIPGVLSCTALARTTQLRQNHTTPVIHIPKANVYRFGDPNTAPPVFRGLQWTVNEGEAWAIIGSGSGEKATLFQTLLGQLRITPPPPPPAGLYPFLAAPTVDPYNSLALVSFTPRRRGAVGAFYDFSARYGAMRDDDRVTLREAMFFETIDPESPELKLEREHDREQEVREAQMTPPERALFERLVDRLWLRDALDVPLVALSNGQMRRARIIKAILRKPELLLLDEPLTGLDVQNRPAVLEVLRSLHASRSPRVILGLRTQDPVPDWITHVAFVKGGKVLAGPKHDVLPTIERVAPAPCEEICAAPTQGEVVVDMRNVNVKYGPRTVLKNIDWQIRKGDRWHLQGPNGSGKTTLLALLTGSHPQSYVQPTGALTLHSLPRARIPTPHLASLTALVSPELFDAFPRRAEAGMTVWEAVGTGFDGTFVPAGKDGVGNGVLGPIGEEERGWRVSRVWEVLEALGPHTWGEDEGEGAGAGGGREGQGQGQGRSPRESAEAFAERKFADLPLPAQRMVLLMRALVGRAPLVLLDEVWSGMGEGMVSAARRYLREGGGVGPEQAVVVVTHWEDEVPWGVQDGVKRFRLEGGAGRVVEE